MQDSPSSTSRPATSSDRRSSPRSKWPSQMPRRRRAHEHTATPRNNGGAPGLLCTRSGPGAPPLSRLRPRRCAVVSALRRGLECPCSPGCGSAATITATEAQAPHPQPSSLQPLGPQPLGPGHRVLAAVTPDAGASWPIWPRAPLGPQPPRPWPTRLRALANVWPRAPLGPLVAGTPGAALSSLLVPVLAQQLLVALAHRGARHLVDDSAFVGHLPLGEALTEGGDDVLPGHLGAVGGHHIGYGALIPLLGGNADDCGFLDARVVEDRVLHVDGGDPLATGLDDVLEPVGDIEYDVVVDDADGAGPPPTGAEAL